MTSSAKRIDGNINAVAAPKGGLGGDQGQQSSTFDRVKGTVVSKLYEAAKMVKQQASNQTGQERNSFQQYGGKAAEWMYKSADYLQAADADQLKSDLTEQVRRNPAQTLVIAGVVGLLLGTFLRRR